MALSPFGESVPRVVYATGTLWSVAPDSSVNEGITAICWWGMRAANGFSGCDWILSWMYSATIDNAQLIHSSGENRAPMKFGEGKDGMTDRI